MVKDVIAGAIRSRVVGPQGRARVVEIYDADGPRWFGPERPIRAVHADSSMFVGGIRAILLQSLHPLAMAGVAQHSDYRDDPWGRLQRTADFLARTTYGTVTQAEDACRRVQAVHEHVVGFAPDGRPYAASDPHLLTWVHVAEVDSFLSAYQRYGAKRLDLAGCDDYVADMAVVARTLGVPHPPTSLAELRASLRSFGPELRATREAREAARFMLAPPLPLTVRTPYSVLAVAALGLLPLRARLALRLPLGPVADAVVVRPAGSAMIHLTRWALSTPPSRSDAD